MSERITIESLSRYYYYEFDKSHEFLGHSHASWEINVVLGGKLNVTYGKSVVTLEKGDIFIGEPFEFHCNRVSGSYAILAVIQFSVKEKGFAKSFSVKHLTREEYALVQLCLEELQSLCPEHGEIRDGASDRYTDVMKMCEVLISRVRKEKSTFSENNSYHATLYRNAVKIMEERISEQLTIGEIAKQLYISEPLLKKVFNECTGGGVMKYFCEMKIQKAKKMLEAGDSVSYVSDTLGFSSQNYFSTVFGKICGKNPKKYQKQLGESQ